MPRRIVTREDVQAAQGGTLEVSTDDVVTEAARDFARRSGVTIRETGGAALAPPPLTTLGPTPVADDHSNQCIVTVVGRNRAFVLAEITTRLGELQGNILDISQKIVGGYFSAILVVDLSQIELFGPFKAELEALSSQGDYRVVVQHARIFQAMHRV